MHIKIAIVEDERDQYEFVARRINDWADKTKQRVTIAYVTSAEEFLFKYDQPATFDILFLDVCMNQMNGMELAKAIRGFDREVQIVFLTGVSDYVFEGYEIGAVRYLIKPIDEKKLSDTLEACLEKLKKRTEDYISFKYLGENIKIARSDIIYVQVNSHYLQMVTTKETYEWKKSLKKMIERLDTKRFVAANRSTVVNLEYVSKITREECILENGETIQVSRGAYIALNEAFMKFYVG